MPGRFPPNLFGLTVLPASSPYYAFAEDGAGELLAWLYGNGDWVSDRGSLTHGGLWPGSYPVVIPFDSATMVGNGSLLWWSGAVDPDFIPTTLHVWDVAGDTLYTRTQDSGWLPAGAAYFGGWIWWIETEATDFDGEHIRMRLRRARADLTGVEMVTAWNDFSPFGFPITSELLPVSFALGSTIAWMGVSGIETVNNETSFDARAKFPLDGSTPTQGGGLFFPTPGIPGESGDSIGGTSVGGAGRLMLLDVTGSESVHWPITGDWAINSSPFVSVSSDLSEVAGFSVSDAALIRSPSTGPYGASPPTRFTVAERLGILPEILAIGE